MMENFRIAPETRIGFVALKVSDLSAMTDFYTKIVGFDLLKQTQDTSYLGVRVNQQVLLTLREIDGVMPNQAVTGLEHFAILLPHSSQQGTILTHIQSNSISLTGVYENGYSQVFAITDPEGNGVEFAVDKTIEKWTSMDKYDWENEMTHDIDAKVILDQKRGSFSGLPSGTTIGHVQLAVKDLQKTADFYTKVLGFSLKPTGNPEERFLSAGDYHHHIGVNLAPENQKLALVQDNNYGLDFVNILLPEKRDMVTLVDNLQDNGYTNFDYSEANEYLMLQDPNNIRLWLSLA
ncbi:VOC family protein [Lactobacillus sp. CC-MHH1034]|uniref:VOC family protein n=1 Tax=Agrilactobacillus fermenti TaxID=2586909 RepID=UPI001E3FAE54|nr:VOC family protein [Agrilactobacillus fermenti]MCD2257128.1 VOC family protein [Agrilactobacillus fermenti]